MPGEEQKLFERAQEVNVDKCNAAEVFPPKIYFDRGNHLHIIWVEESVLVMLRVTGPKAFVIRPTDKPQYMVKYPVDPRGFKDRSVDQLMNPIDTKVGEGRVGKEGSRSGQPSRVRSAGGNSPCA